MWRGLALLTVDIVVWESGPDGARRVRDRSVALEHFDQRLAEPCGRGRHADAGGFHRGDLVLGAALAARDDRAGVAHAAARRRRAAGDEAHHRLLAAALRLVPEELSRVFF